MTNPRQFGKLYRDPQPFMGWELRTNAIRVWLPTPVEVEEPRIVVPRAARVYHTEYRFRSGELVHWRDEQGQRLEGLAIPEGPLPSVYLAEIWEPEGAEVEVWKMEGWRYMVLEGHPSDWLAFIRLRDGDTP